MKMNPHGADAVYKQVGEEIARKEFSPGAMARAVAESMGDKSLVESLYAKFRFEELVREMEREIIAKKQQREDTAKPYAVLGTAINSTGEFIVAVVIVVVIVVVGVVGGFVVWKMFA
jgi:hypothetical protein